MVTTERTKRDEAVAEALRLLGGEGFATTILSDGPGKAAVAGSRGGHRFEFRSLGEIKAFLEAGYWRVLTEPKHWRFLTCGDCHIAEEYSGEEPLCGHCGSDNLRASTSSEVRANLPFLRQRAERSYDEAMTYERARRFLESPLD